MMTTQERSSGILMHPTSLPGRFGIGELGREAYRFVEKLASAKQGYWQVLPLTPTGYGDSPYQGPSAFAGNPLLISLEKLLEQGHLEEHDLDEIPIRDPSQVDFERVRVFKEVKLKAAYSRFKTTENAESHQRFQSFSEAQASWLEDFSVYMAIKVANDLRPWYEWERPLAFRESDAIAAVNAELASEIEYQKYLQWQFFDQWIALKHYANERDVRILGDMPIFVSYDSADVWANSEIFELDENLTPQVVSGVPPDYFSETGQLWGHPLYDWGKIESLQYQWWLKRFRQALLVEDAIRIDHFRGFVNYWEIPSKETTAINGRWVDGPGEKFFNSIKQGLGELEIIAEDLGDFDDDSRRRIDQLMDQLGFPGMKILFFAFGSGSENPFLPHNYESNCVVYTSSHDSDTILGWYENHSQQDERDFARKYLSSDGSDISWEMIRLAWSSVAKISIASMQDVLSLSSEARMNTPGTVGPPNWCWRMEPDAFHDGLVERLKELTIFYGREAGK